MSNVEDALKFLNVLFRTSEGSLHFENGGVTETVKPETVKSYVSENPNVRVLPVGENGIYFFFAASEPGEKDDWSRCRIRPTAELWREGVSILCWALKVPADLHDPRVGELCAWFGMTGPEEPLPIPGTASFELAHCEATKSYTLDELSDAYLGQEAENPDADSNAGAGDIYRDAKITTHFDPADYADRNIVISFGKDRFCKDWIPKEIPLIDLIDRFTVHEIGKKDGYAVVLADMVRGQRLKQTVKVCTAIGLDIDTGCDGAFIDRQLAKLRCLAMRATTHSHNKTSTDFKKDRILKMFPEADEVTSDMMKEYVRETQFWEERLILTIEYIGDDQTEQGIVCRAKHDPMPKHRIIVPIDPPFVIAEEGRLQQEAMAKWAKVIEALAARLSVVFDKACTDPSRLFYLPRHDKDRPFEISLFGGPLFDWRTLELDDPFEKLAKTLDGKGSRSVTQAGKDLGGWWKKRSDGFQVVQVLEELAPDRVRSPASCGYHIECPFDEDHSNAGDPNDLACFAVNAADGTYEICFVRCQHETCKNKTTLDMLGKMIQDGWFETKVLEDADYNVVNYRDEEKAKATEAHQEQGESDKEGSGHNQGQGETEQWFHDLRKKIDELTKDSPPSAVAHILDELAAHEDAMGVELLVGRLKRVTGADVKTLRQTLNGARQAKTKAERKSNESKAGSTQESVVEQVHIFEHIGGVDVQEAILALKQQLIGFNKADLARGRKETLPRYTQTMDEILELRGWGTDKPRLVNLSEHTFRSTTAQVMLTVKLDKEGNAGATQLVPKDVASVVYQSAATFLPETPELIFTPIVAGNGDILDYSGWHTGSGLQGKPDTNVLLHMGDLKVPTIAMHPSKEDLKSAISLLLDMLKEFHFCDVDAAGVESSEASKANALAMILTPFLRRYFDDCTPIFLMEKPSPGAGATLLSQVPQILYCGATFAPTSYTDNEEEMQKVFVSKILGNEPLICFDNVEELSSRTLKQVVTSKIIGGRILGRSQMTSRENNFLFMATGINPLIFGDMIRRVVRIRLDTKVENNQELTYTRNLVDWVTANRADLIWSILVLFQSWHSAGAKKWTKPPLASFDKWSSVLGGVLEHAGVPGFLTNPRKANFDSEDTNYRIFAKTYFERWGGERMNFEALYNWAGPIEFEFITGRDDGQKKASLRKIIQAIDGRTFKIGKLLVVPHVFETEKEGVTFGFSVIPSNADVTGECQ